MVLGMSFGHLHDRARHHQPDRHRNGVHRPLRSTQRQTPRLLEHGLSRHHRPDQRHWLLLPLHQDHARHRPRRSLTDSPRHRHLRALRLPSQRTMAAAPTSSPPSSPFTSTSSSLSHRPSRRCPQSTHWLPPRPKRPSKSPSSSCWCSSSWSSPPRRKSFATLCQPNNVPT